jgi:hypothetical protein
MASKEQYEYYKFLYDHERSRYLELVNRGKLFLSIITLYMGLLAVGADKTISGLESSILLTLVYFISVFLLVASLVAVVLAIGIYKNEKPSSPREMILSLKDNVPTDDEFRDERVVDLAVATDRNSENNDLRAKRLQVSSYLLILGILGQALFLYLYVIN